MHGVQGVECSSHFAPTLKIKRLHIHLCDRFSFLGGSKHSRCFISTQGEKRRRYLVRETPPGCCRNRVLPSAGARFPATKYLVTTLH